MSTLLYYHRKILSMLWKFRAINNKVAKRRYFLYSLTIILTFVAGAIYRLETGTRPGKVAILLAISIMLIFLYTVIALGRERYYSMDESEIVYRPLKTKIEDVENFEVDEENRLIRLKLRKNSPFAVKTLYFDDIKDLREAEMFLRRWVRCK